MLRRELERLLVLTAALACVLSTPGSRVNAADAQGGFEDTAALQQLQDSCGSNNTTQDGTRVAMFHASDPNYIQDSAPDSAVRASVISAYLYCLNHGYTYLQVRNHQNVSGAGHFFKPGALVGMLEYALDRFDVIVMLDADTLFMQPQQPLLPLLDRMGFNAPGVVVAAPQAPAVRKPASYHHNNHSFPPEIQVNTGFMAWKPSQRALEIARSWDTCVVKFPGCARWKKKFFFDQGAFNTYIRWDVMAPGELLELPCRTFNGYDNRTFGPGFDNRGCMGTFFSHFWNAKSVFHRLHTGFLLQELMKRVWCDVPALDVFT